MALNVVPVMPIVRTIYTWLGILVLCKVCYRSAPLNAVYVATVFCALALITELLCLKLLAIMGWEYLDVMSPGYERAIYILIAKVCQLALVIIAVPLMHREHSLLKLKSLLPLLACQIFSVYFCDEILRLTQNGGRKLSGIDDYFNRHPLSQYYNHCLCRGGQSTAGRAAQCRSPTATA